MIIDQLMRPYTFHSSGLFSIALYLTLWLVISHRKWPQNRWCLMIIVRWTLLNSGVYSLYWLDWRKSSTTC